MLDGLPNRREGLPQILRGAQLQKAQRQAGSGFDDSRSQNRHGQFHRHSRFIRTE